MNAVGKLIEVGVLDDGSGDLGVVIQRPNRQHIVISGLTMDETRAAAQFLFKTVTISLAAGVPP